MDLRRYSPSENSISEAARLLHYQPFRLDDALITGVGHSWMYGTDGRKFAKPQFLFDKRVDSAERWREALEAYERLSCSYSTFADAIASACPQGSYLDLCCNSGLMPVLASLRGMSPAVGSDAGDFSATFTLLNKITGARAQFRRSEFEITERRMQPPFERRFDVVSCMAYLLHVPEPLQFLRIISDLTGHAVLLWSTFFSSDEKLIRYTLANKFLDLPFPFGFDGGVGLSDTMLIYSMRELGFPRYREIVPLPDAWPTEWGNPLMKPYQPLRAFIFTR